MFGAPRRPDQLPVRIVLRDLEVGVALLLESRLIRLPLPVRHAAVPRQRLQAWMPRQRALHKRVKGLPAHRRSAGVKTLEAREHIQVVVEASPESLGQRGGLPLEEEREVLPLQPTHICEDDYGKRQGTHERQRDGESPLAPDVARFGEPAEDQWGHDEDADGVPHPPRLPTDAEQVPGDDAAERQRRDPDGGAYQAAQGPAQQQKEEDLACLGEGRREAHDAAHQARPRQGL